jgi:hypothetical protein
LIVFLPNLHSADRLGDDEYDYINVRYADVVAARSGDLAHDTAARAQALADVHRAIGP